MATFFAYFFPLLAGSFYAWGFPIKGIPSFFMAPLLSVLMLFGSWSLFRDVFCWKSDLKKIFLFYLGAWFAGYNWIPETLRIFGEIDFPWNYALGSLSSLIILPQFLGFFLFLLWCRKKIRQSKIVAWIFYPLNLALLMTLCEEFVPQLFPTHLGHPYLALAPYLGLAPWIGVAGFSFLSYWAVFEFLFYFLQKKGSSLFLQCRPNFILLGVIWIFFIFGNVFLKLEFIPNSQRTMNVRLVQANLESYLKVASEKGNSSALREVFALYRTLSFAPVERPLDLLIWPETAYPYTLDLRNRVAFNQDIPLFFTELSSMQLSDLLMGGYEWGRPENKDDFETTYNSTFYFKIDSQKKVSLVDAYQKMLLIPFGETLPFGPLNSFLGSYIKNISYFKKGEHFTLFEARKKNYFISAICYEILFSSFIREYLSHVQNPPHFLVNLTNDSWYGDTNEPYQHLFLAKWRALEFNLPIVRSTNSGISTILYPDGSEAKRLKYGEKGVLDTELFLRDRVPTFFEKFGLGGTFVLWGIFLFFSVLRSGKISFSNWRNLLR